MQIHDDQFMTVHYDNQANIIKHVWKSTSADLTDDLFKKQLELFTKLIVDRKAKAVAADTRDFLFGLSVEIQEWIVANFFGLIIPAGVKKYALTVSSDMLTQVSIEQVIEDEKTQSFATKYFDDFDKAFEWAAK